MSSNHVTPPEIARALARHAPKSVTRVLDPAVGDGSLLLPLLDRVCHSRCEVTAVDIDPAAILSASVHLSHPVAVRELVCSDFLEWARRNPCGNQFDCVVANPPFAGRRSDWVGVTLSRPWVENETDPALCPVEVAFIIACVHALQPGGRLLAIVPSSIVASSRCAWLRRGLFAQGAIRLVHELPRCTFPGVESRFYFLVFDKSVRTREFVLCNHDLHHPDRLVMRRSRLDFQLRLDHSFHDSTSNYFRHLEKQQLGWRRLCDVASLHRGSVRTPDNWPSAIHTSHYRSGFWGPSQCQALDGGAKQAPTIQRGDLLIKRVGRNCSQSLGSAVGITTRTCSDCVLIVRPFAPSKSTQLLFALRCLLNARWARPLVERGTGASYLSRDSLRVFRFRWLSPNTSRVTSSGTARHLGYETSSQMRSVEMLVCKHLDW